MALPESGGGSGCSPPDSYAYDYKCRKIFVIKKMFVEFCGANTKLGREQLPPLSSLHGWCFEQVVTSGRMFQILLAGHATV